jgi:hypothetical protein
MLSAHVEQTVPNTKFSPITPNWFTVSLTANRIVAKPLERAITVAVDFAGFTSGDPDRLVDLTRTRGLGSIYLLKVGPTANNPDHVLSRIPEQTGSSIAVAINIDLISGVVRKQISRQIGADIGLGAPYTSYGTYIGNNLYLHSVSAGYSSFEKPLRGIEDGLKIGFKVGVDLGFPIGVIDVTGRIYVQPYLRYPQGPTEYTANNPEVWCLSVGAVEIDTPWWLDLAITVFGIYVGVAIPFLAPFIGVLGTVLLGGLIPGLLQNAESLLQTEGQHELGNPVFHLPTAFSEALPGLNKRTWGAALAGISITMESIDVAINAGGRDDEEPRGIIVPQSCDARDISPIRLRLKLREDLERLGGDKVILSWEVRRADTKQVIASGSKSYNDPGGNGIRFKRHTSELYAVDSFIVRCTASLTLGSQVGEIWSGKQMIAITDVLDRHYKYLQWGPHQVFFKNNGTDGEWWTHIRRSRIHRTAVCARCNALRGVSGLQGSPDWTFDSTYSDTLPFPWEALNQNRKVLCEYCFFGGPDKHVPFPQEDWFVREL